MIDFDPYSKTFGKDPYLVYKQLRDDAPVFHQADLNFWAISRYADVLSASRDAATYCSGGGVSIEGLEAGMPLLLVTDAPAHQWHKALTTKVFTPARMASLEPFIRKLVVELLEQAGDKDAVDIVKDFSLQVPLQVISELIGIPEEYRQEIHDLTNLLISREEGRGMEDIIAAQMRTLEIYMSLVTERRKQPREDPITYLIQSEVRDETGELRRLTDDEMAWRFGELATAGHETVAKAIPAGMMAFQSFPEERRRLREDPGLLGSTVEEVLRFDPPSQLQGRTTTRDVELHGEIIPNGSRVMLLTGAAVRDERKFVDPDRFDIGRPAGSDSIYFGNGVHKCLGIHLARLELKIVFEELFRRFPDFEVEPDRATRAVLSNVRGVSTLPGRMGPRRH